MKLLTVQTVCVRDEWSTGERWWGRGERGGEGEREEGRREGGKERRRVSGK